MSDVSDEIVERMAGLVRALADVPRDSVLGQSGYASEARTIAAELPNPVDADVLAVREILAGYTPETDQETVIRAGGHDGRHDFLRALAAFKRVTGAAK